METLQKEDPEKHKNIQHMLDNKDEVEYLYQTFSVTDEADPSGKTEVELKPNGAKIDVVADNVEEYAGLLMQYALRKRVDTMMLAFCNGFWEVVGQDHKIFTVIQLEEFMCGKGELDMADWMANTDYKGSYSQGHKVVKWFWEHVEAMSSKQRIVLLNFCTGSKCIPIAGFSALEKVPGQLMPFALNSMRYGEHDHENFPKGHTCTNTIDLPEYPDKATLVKMLDLALNGSGGCPGANDGSYFME